MSLNQEDVHKFGFSKILCAKYNIFELNFCCYQHKFVDSTQLASEDDDWHDIQDVGEEEKQKGFAFADHAN